MPYGRKLKKFYPFYFCHMGGGGWEGGGGVCGVSVGQIGCQTFWTNGLSDKWANPTKMKK